MKGCGAQPRESQTIFPEKQQFVEMKLHSDSPLGLTLRYYKIMHFRRFIPNTSGRKESVCFPYGISSFLIIQPPKSQDEQFFIYCSSFA